jgi:hypothetical protein
LFLHGRTAPFSDADLLTINHHFPHAGEQWPGCAFRRSCDASRTLAATSRPTATSPRPPAARFCQLQLAAASHSRPTLAAAGHSMPGRSTGILASPAIVKVEPLNPVDAILDVDTTLAFHFVYTCHLYMFIHDHLSISMNGRAVPSCRSIFHALVSFSCAMEMCYSGCRLCVCVVCLWTEPSRRSRGRTSLECLGRGFILMWQ